MLDKIIKFLLGDQNKKTLDKITPLVPRINAFEEAISKLSDEALKGKTIEFRARIDNGETEDNLLPEAFAVVREAAKRTLGERHYDVQLIGGVVLHQGKIAEMKTGEGKTLVATLPVYLNALRGKGVHVITVNDYLAKRDAEWMGKVYEALGMSCKYVIHGLSNEQRRDAYNADITYGTNNEFGFDYLRDNMAVSAQELVQRDLHYAIVDEVDSILIDEARTPLIISAPNQESTDKYVKYAYLVRNLKETIDYTMDEKTRSVVLSENGISKMEGLLGMKNIYSEAGFGEVHHIEQALKAKTLFKIDRDYVVKEDEVIIVDEFTGRLMPGRRFSEGLHQAIEAKENVKVRRESKTLATITFQNYFRLYHKLAGMTGTAYTEAEEFRTIYGLDPVIIPTNQQIRREDRPDAIFKNERGKFSAISDHIEEVHKTGQPILVGTISIEKSEELSKVLRRKKIPHQVLNAKHHDKEAEIVKNAGQFGSVTIATNMAGRGTDIKLGEGVVELGGLYIIGTERHESRRIDNQLRGRSGRQGDPGLTQFYISMEDNLPKLFGSEKIKNMMETFNIPEDMPIENRIVSKAIENAQKRVEGHNFDIRKHILEYDDVLNKQRGVIYNKRHTILTSETISDDVKNLIEKEAEDIVNMNIDPEKGLPNFESLERTFHSIIGEQISLEKTNHVNDLIDFLKKTLLDSYTKKREMVSDEDRFNQVERFVYLRALDALWMEHIDQMAYLRDEVSLQGYGQRDPLQLYQHESYGMFIDLLRQIQTNTVATLFHINIEADQNLKKEKKEIYLTNENDIEDGSSGVKGFQKKQGTKTTVRLSEDQKVGRNDPCPCGSGKKYKKCCGR